MRDNEIGTMVCQKTKLMNRLTGTCNQITQILNRHLMEDLSLSLAKYEVLVAIDDSENGEITMSNLSRELNVSNANMTGMTSRLQADGYLQKKSLPTDRRIFSVVLTDEGEDILEKAKVKYSSIVRDLLAKIDDQQAADFSNFLAKIVGN